MSDKESTAVFIGNRDCYGVNIESIKETILYTIQSGITTFLSGGQGYFDEVCATIVYPAPKTAAARDLNCTLAARGTAPPTLI